MMHGLVAQMMQGFDETDAYSRRHPENVPVAFSLGKIAIPAQLEFYGDELSRHAFDIAIERIKALGYQVESLILQFLISWQNAFYNRSWVAERTVAVEKKINRDQAHPVIQKSLHRQINFLQQMSCRMNMIELR
jgi:allophanate hydrolase